MEAVPNSLLGFLPARCCNDENQKRAHHVGHVGGCWHPINPLVEISTSDALTACAARPSARSILPTVLGRIATATATARR